MDETIINNIDRFQLCFQELCSDISAVEEMKTQIALVTNLNFSEDVARITSAEANTYSVAVQISRMIDVVELLLHGISKEQVLELLENQKEHDVVCLIKE